MANNTIENIENRLASVLSKADDVRNSIKLYESTSAPKSELVDKALDAAKVRLITLEELSEVFESVKNNPESLADMADYFVQELFKIENTFDNVAATITSVVGSSSDMGSDRDLSQDEIDAIVSEHNNQSTGNAGQLAGEIQRNFERVTSVPALEDLREQNLTASGTPTSKQMDKTWKEMLNNINYNKVNTDAVMQEIAEIRARLSNVNVDNMSDDEKEVYSQVVTQFLDDAERDVNDAKNISLYKDIDVQNRNEKLRSAMVNIANAISNLGYFDETYLDENLVDLDNNKEMVTSGNDGTPDVSSTQGEVDPTSDVEELSASGTPTSEQIVDENQENNETETVMNREESMFQQGASSYYDPERPLISRFMRYFDTSMPSNSFQAIDFGKHIFRYMLPNDRIPQDSESLMNMTRLTLQQRDGFTDKDFVRLVIDKVNDNPGLITFDMVADLVESDAYKNYGTTSGSEFGRKQKFERWICDKSVLKKVEDPVVCALHEDSMKRVAAAIMPEKDKEKYFTKIDGKIAEFEDVCAKKIREDKSLITQLEANTRQQGESGIRENALQKVRDMYGIICTPPFGALYGEKISTDDASKSTIAEKNIAASGHVAYANMTLEALAKRGAISQKDLQKVTIDELPFKDKTQSQPQLKKRGVAFYVGDVLKTAGSSFVGATAFSILGKICPPAAGIAAAALLAGSGFKAARDEYKKLDKNPEYTKLQKIRKAALKGTSAVVTKGIPALAAVAFGPVARVFGAAGVAVRSFVEDVEHRAEMQRQNQQALEENQNQLQQNEEGNQQRHKKGIKGFISDFVGGIKDKFNKTRENIKSLKGKDIGKSVAYGISKGIAMYFGAQAGIGLGNALGDNLNTEIADIREQQANKMTTKEIVNENMKDVGDNLRKGGFDLEDAQANPEGVEANEVVNNTQIPSHARQFIAENPDAYFDKNGYLCMDTPEGTVYPKVIVNEDGSAVFSYDKGQIMNNGNAITRELYSHETLDQWGNIIDKPGYSSLSQNNTDISNEPPVNATFEGRESLDEIQANKFDKVVNKGNDLLGDHKEQMIKEINRVDSPNIREEMMQYNENLMKDFETAVNAEQANILEDGKVTWGESRKYTNMVKGFTSKRMQDITNAINNNNYDYEPNDYEPSVNAQFSNPNLENVYKNQGDELSL